MPRKYVLYLTRELSPKAFSLWISRSPHESNSRLQNVFLRSKLLDPVQFSLWRCLCVRQIPVEFGRLWSYIVGLVADIDHGMHTLFIIPVSFQLTPRLWLRGGEAEGVGLLVRAEIGGLPGGCNHFTAHAAHYNPSSL